MSDKSLTGCWPASAAVVDAVAASEGVDPATLTTPLYDAIDPEAWTDSSTASSRGRRPIQ